MASRPTVILAGLCLAGLFQAPAAASSSSSSAPWPAIPTQAVHTEPTGEVLVGPKAVVKGLTNDTSAPIGSSAMIFNTVNETYTRKITLSPWHDQGCKTNHLYLWAVDYGRVLAGKPFFQVEAVDEYAQIEVKFTESYNPQGDGPFAFGNGLGATFRVETHNITKTGDLRGYFIQGSQRWQSIKFVRGSGLTISRAGFVSSISEQPTSTWDITTDGAYIRGQKPASTAHIVNIKNYTMTFEAKIDYGGVGWRVDTEIDAIQATGPLFVLTSEYPEGSFANIDRELVPPNTLVVGRGWSLVNQTSLPAFVLQKFPIGIAVTEKKWHTITTISLGDDTYRVLLNDKEIASFNISSYGLGAPNPHIPGGYSTGFALGPWQDQAAYYRNVKIVSNMPDSKVLYENALTSPDVPREFGVATNDQYICSDGGKRDRFLWLGDMYISARSGLVSTGEPKYISGTAEMYFSRQTAAGHIPCNTLFSPLDMESTLIRTGNVDPLLVDYNFEFIQIVWDYWMRTGNNTILDIFYPQLLSMTSYSVARALDHTTQLYGAPAGADGAPLGGQHAQALGPAETVSMILGLERMADISAHMNDPRSALVYRTQANLTREAIDSRLWNETGGYYAGRPGYAGFDMADTAQVLLAQIGTAERRSRAIEALQDFRGPVGYGNGTRFASAPTVVSPFLNSFLLEGFAKEGRTSLAQDLLDSLWAPMIRQDRNFTGTGWEYVSADGVQPGLGLFTSGSHGWGTYATAFLTDYVLGVRPATPGFSTFTFKPLPGFKTEWVHGRVPTPKGEILAAWGYESSGRLAMEITVPQGLEGTIMPPFDGKYSVTGGSAQKGQFAVKGGSTVKICQL
ncbi:Six-hairpin glycosidase-like protein [Microdochium bolleyi]|uniref:Six-hairpin glycosidase-like protein n=1 Tax=Microdochium bolleyi TaxID=196109 RepID=A0A136IS65_9PEZI|nr:Six-hairpin glycosidase-like protein [Microdochium bolleyi]